MPAFSFVLSLVAACGHEEGTDLGTGIDAGVDARPGPDAAGLGRCYSGIDGYDPDGGYELCEAGSVCSRVSKGGIGAACLGADAYPDGTPCGVITCGTADWGCDCVDGAVSACACEFITSTARAKRDIAYVDEATEERLRNELLGVRLATYRYKPGFSRTDDTHLGFIIEDMPAGSPAVASPRHVDLYGFVSMAVAAIKAQQRELDALRARVARLEGGVRYGRAT
jgi:hypothetical protein